jgi:hypothetical protein
MNNDIPQVELPEFATLSDRLSRNVEFAREAVSYRVGYEVELAGVEPIQREGRASLRIYWRRKSDTVMRNELAPLAS